MNPALQRQLDRWYGLKDIPEQVRLITEDYRFKVVPAGRRSGKTERAKRYLAKQAMRYPDEKYFAAAPTQDQARKTWWADLRALMLSAAHPTHPTLSPPPEIVL